jgi:hypothetical protein
VEVFPGPIARYVVSDGIFVRELSENGPSVKNLAAQNSFVQAHDEIM